MRAAGLVLALLFAAATASAQATFELVSAPDAAIGAVSVAVPGSPPPPAERSGSREHALGQGSGEDHPKDQPPLQSAERRIK